MANESPGPDDDYPTPSQVASLLGYLEYVLGSHAMAEAVFHETLGNLQKTYGKHSGRQNFARLWKTAKLLATDRIRAAGGDGLAEARIAALLEPTVSLETTCIPPQEREAHEARRKLLYEAIERLSFEQKQVFVLRFVAGLRVKEIARRLSISPKAVERRLERAMENLRKDLPPDGSNQNQEW